MHTIAYTVEGLLEGGILLQVSRYVEAAKRTADELLCRQHVDGSLAGAYAGDWRESWYVCPTGVAQMATIWARLHQITGDPRYEEAVLHANRYLKACQRLYAGFADLRGALPGSRPSWGRYMFMRFPNWAVKYFADALIAEMRLPSRKLQPASVAGSGLRPKEESGVARAEG